MPNSTAPRATLIDAMVKLCAAQFAKARAAAHPNCTLEDLVAAAHQGRRYATFNFWDAGVYRRDAPRRLKWRSILELARAAQKAAHGAAHSDPRQPARRRWPLFRSAECAQPAVYDTLCRVAEKGADELTPLERQLPEAIASRVFGTRHAAPRVLAL